MSEKLLYKKSHIDSLLLPARQAERAAHISCAQARSFVRDIQARLEQLHRSIQSNNDSVRQALFQGGRVANSGLYRKSVIDIAGAIAEQSSRLAEADNKLQLSRTRLLAAINKRKVSSGLAERANARRRRQAERAQTKEYDELHMCNRAAERIADAHSTAGEIKQR